MRRPLPQDLKDEYQKLIAALRAVYAVVADVDARALALEERVSRSYNDEVEFNAPNALGQDVTEESGWNELCAWALAIELALATYTDYPQDPHDWETRYWLPEGFGDKVEAAFETERSLVTRGLGAS